MGPLGGSSASLASLASLTCGSGRPVHDALLRSVLTMPSKPRCRKRQLVLLSNLGYPVILLNSYTGTAFVKALCHYRSFSDLTTRLHSWTLSCSRTHPFRTLGAYYYSVSAVNELSFTSAAPLPYTCGGHPDSSFNRMLHQDLGTMPEHPTWFSPCRMPSI